MPRNTTWYRRKYIVQNNKAKNLCQVYKIQLYDSNKQSQNKSSHSQYLENTNKTIRIDKNPTNYQIPYWAQVNQREEFGYSRIPESPIAYFDDHDDNDFYNYYDTEKDKYNRWQYIDTKQNWVQY